MGAILGIFGFIFKDWRMVLALVVVVIAGIIVWKFKHLESELNHTKDVLKVEQSNNQVLRNNLDQAGQINADNAKMIEAAEAEKKRALEAVSQLNTDLKRTNQSIDAIKQKISGITTPPTKLSPFLVEAVRGVQDLRDAENPPIVKLEAKPEAKPADAIKKVVIVRPPK